MPEIVNDSSTPARRANATLSEEVAGHDAVPTTSADGIFSFTVFESCKKPKGKRKPDRSWRDFFDKLVARAPAAKRPKADLPGWNPATFQDDQRSNKLVQAVYAVAFDFDGKSPVTIDQAVAAWPGCLQIIHTTYSHKPECPRFRQVLPYSRPVSDSEHGVIWQWGAARLSDRGMIIDESCCDAARLWFLPVQQDGYEHRWVDGRYLDVDAILAAASQTPPPDSEPRDTNPFEQINAIPIVDVARALGLDTDDPTCPWCDKKRDAANKSQISFGFKDSNLYKCFHAGCGAKSTNCVGLIGKVILHIDDAKGMPKKHARQVLEWARDNLGLDIGRRTRPQSVANHDNQKTEIRITTEEPDVIKDAIAALARDPDIYQRGNRLARVLGTTLDIVPEAVLQAKLAGVARWVQFSRTKDWVPAHPPHWAVKAIDQWGVWDGIRKLRGVVEYPVMRQDGTVLDTPGYDDATGLLFRPNADFLPVPKSPTKEQVKAAVDDLLDVVCDFPFDGDRHKGAWLASELTPFARYAYEGCTPFFMITANTTRAGKGLLADTTMMLALGRHPLHGANGATAEEQDKRIASIIREGHPLYLVDNIKGWFGGQAWEAVLTSRVWSGRVLGITGNFTTEVQTIFFGTGNNVRTTDDINGRVIHIRLRCQVEHPESRDDFKHDPLDRYVIENRPRLVQAALTILRAYHHDGRPDQKVRLGGFDGWAQLVASAVVWCGLPNPVLTQADLSDGADSDLGKLRALVFAWRQSVGVVEEPKDDHAPTTAGHKAQDIIHLLQSDGFDADDDSVSMGEPEHGELRAALIELGGKDGKLPSAVSLGKALGRHRDRVAKIEIGDGKMQSFALKGDTDRKGVTRWRLVAVGEEELAGDAGDCRGSDFNNPGTSKSYETSCSSTLAGDAGDHSPSSRGTMQNASHEHDHDVQRVHVNRGAGSNPGIPGTDNETPCSTDDPAAGVVRESTPAPSPASPAHDDELLSPEQWAGMFELHARTRGIVGDHRPPPSDPVLAGLTPGVYAATIEGFDEQRLQIRVRYIAQHGSDIHYVWMPSSPTFNMLRELAQHGQLQCQLVIRHNSQAWLWPLGYEVDESIFLQGIPAN